MRKLLWFAVALLLVGCGDPEVAVTTTEAVTTTTVTATTTTEAVTEIPPIVTDVVVVGDSLAGAGAVQALLDAGLDVVLIPETGYIGGQAAAAGVSSMDEQDGVGFLSRDVWPYSGLVDEYRATRHEPDPEYGLPYFSGFRGRNAEFGPEPVEVRDFLQLATAGARVIEFDVTDVLQEAGVVVGVTDGVTEIRGIVVDATEFQDLYPMVEGLRWTVAECVQHTTWLAVRDEESALWPSEDALEAVYEVYGSTVDKWLEQFRKQLTLDGQIEFPESGSWNDMLPSWSPEFEWHYREVAGGHTSLNRYNDSRMTPEAITDPVEREALLLEAKAKTWVELWYLRWELGVTQGGIATDQGYEQVDQMYWSDVIPDEVEQFFPPIPYVREGRTLADPVMIWSDITERSKEPLADEGLLQWGYAADSHGCFDTERASRYGLFRVDPEILQSGVEGFWPGMLRGARVDAVVASSVRMQPSEYIGGYRVGEAIAEG